MSIQNFILGASLALIGVQSAHAVSIRGYEFSDTEKITAVDYNINSCGAFFMVNPIPKNKICLHEECQGANSSATEFFSDVDFSVTSIVFDSVRWLGPKVNPGPFGQRTDDKFTVRGIYNGVEQDLFVGSLLDSPAGEMRLGFTGNDLTSIELSSVIKLSGGALKGLIEGHVLGFLGHFDVYGFNGKDFRGIGDFMLLRPGTGEGSTEVPEPASMALLAIGVFGARKLRKATW